MHGGASRFAPIRLARLGLSFAFLLPFTVALAASPSPSRPDSFLPVADLSEGQQHSIVLAQAAVSVPAAPPPDQVQGPQPPPPDQAVADGRVVYRYCQACHSLEPGRTLIGPSLADIYGRHSASIANFNYSPAMRQANITWDEKALDEYLANPQKLVPGNRMPFPGLKSATDRYDVIAFLRSRSSQPNAATRAGAAPTAMLPPAPAQHVPTTPPTPANQAPKVPALNAMMPELHYTVRTGIADGRMVFIGVGGAIDGQINPTLTAAVGETVQVTLLNGEGAEHDIAFPAQSIRSGRVTGRGSSTTIAFTATSLESSNTTATCRGIARRAWRADSPSPANRRQRH